MDNRQIMTDDDVFGAPAPVRMTDDDVFGPAQTTLTDDDVFGPEKGGVMDYVGNIGRGIGERAAKLGGGIVRGVATAVEPVGDWLQRNVGDFVQEADGSITFRRLTEQEAAQPSGVLSAGQSTAGKLEKVDLGYEPGTTWEDFKSSPIKKFIPFALEQGLVSTPDMVAALTNLPAYIAARTGEMGQERAQNNSLDNATVEDLLTVMPGAVASSMLERIGASGIFKDVAIQSAKQLPGAVLKAGAKEGLTEAGQELIEYGSTNIGTDAGFDPATAGERMAAGAVGGAGFGGMARAATAGVESTLGRDAATTDQSTATPADAEPKLDGYYRVGEEAAPPANADSADILFGSDPETAQPATPERVEAVERMVPVDPERLDSPRLTQEDRASPLPNDMIDDGKAAIDAAVSGEPVASPQTRTPTQTVEDTSQTVGVAPAISVGEAAPLLGPAVQPATPAVPQPSAPPASMTVSPIAQRRLTPDGFPADRYGNVRKPTSIIEFLAERGGIRDPKGDLAAMGLKGGKDSFVSGSGSLVRKGGMPLDYARKLAVEAGYLTDNVGDGTSQSTVTDLLDAIDQDARSGRTFFSQADANQAIRWQEERQAQQDLDQYGSDQEMRLNTALDEVVSLTGSDRADPVAVDIATLMAQDDLDFDTAAIEVERRIDEKLAGTGREYRFEPPLSLKDIPFFGDAATVSARIEDGQFPGDATADAGAVYEDRAGGGGAGNPIQGPRAERGLEGVGRTSDGSRTVQADARQRTAEPRSEVAPEKNQPAVGRAIDRSIAGRNVRFPDEYHAELFDLGATLLRMNGINPDLITAGTQTDDLAPENLSLPKSLREEIWRLRRTIGSYMDPVITTDDEMAMAAMEVAASEAEIAASKKPGRNVEASSLIGVDAQQDWGRALTAELRGLGEVQPWDGVHSIALNDNAPRQSQASSEEIGADGKPQLVIPGAEQISQREQAQRKADAKLKPKVEQRDAGGMFGDDANAPQLFDKPVSKAKVEPKVSSTNQDQKLFSKAADEPLYVVHNLSETKFRKALEIGGLAAPSLAVARGDIGFDAFGEISLIGEPKLSDPKTKGVRTFNADVYSPRQPRASFRVNGKAARAMRSIVEPVANKLGLRFSAYDEDIERDGLSAIEGQVAVKAAWLESLGEDVPVVYEEVAPRRAVEAVPGFEDFKETNAWSIAKRPDFEKAALAYVQARLDFVKSSTRNKEDLERRTKIVQDRFFDENGKLSVSGADQIASVVASRNLEMNSTEVSPAEKRVDRYQTGEAIDQKIGDRIGEYNSWVNQKFGDVVGSAFFETEAGRKKDYTLDNLVREMTRTLRNGEKWNYGAGNVRAAVAPEFKSLAEIKGARGKITSTEAMEKLKEEVNNELFALADKFAPYHPSGKDFGWGDIFSEFLKDVAKGPRFVSEWQTAIFSKPAPDALISEAVDYLEKLKGLPTNYFEIKMQRAMRFSEFTAAVVPSNVSSDVRQSLQDAGLEIIEYTPGDNQSRKDAVAKIGDRAFFQKEVGLSEDFKGDIDAVTADLRERLDKLGLPDVALRVVPVIEGYANGEKFEAHGSYFRGLIEISLQAPDKSVPLKHEAIHALKNLNAFTKAEWSMLSAKSKSDWIGRYGINEAYSESSEAVRIEEGIAAAYTEWAAGREKAGAFARLFQRIKDVIASLGNALRGKGYDSVGKIFMRVESGDVGNSRFFKNDADADGGARFQLVMAPETQMEAKQVMQGFIARGQPIDRAIRLPFEVFGGINKNGTWNPAQKINDKLGNSGRLGLGMGGVVGAGLGGVVGGPVGAAVGGTIGATAGVALLRANINPNGQFGWLYPFAENARRGLVDRYGLSDEYVEADKARQTAQRGVMQKAQDILQVLQNASVGPAEAKVLQSVLTGENVSDVEMLKVAAPIRKAIDELGAEAVSLGLISAESFERNRGAYLHRVYQKNEMDQGGVASWASKFMARKRVGIMGDQFKGRGLFWDVPVSRLMADVPGWAEGKIGAPANGDKFKVLDFIAGTSKDMLSGEDRDTTTKRRVYLPEDKPVPKQFQGSGWVDRGTWEVRGTGKNVTIWRDYTKEERTKMGEILDARYTIAKTFMLMANDLSTGRFYKQVAENEQWAQKQPPATEWREAADYGRFWNDPTVGWVKVPETTIANSGGKKRYGALSGMFVRAEIWRDLNEADQMSKPGIWRTVLTEWKKNKTGRSPVTHMNNIMSNMMFMDLGDVRMQDLVSGIRSFIKEDKNYIEARDAGAFGSDMIAQEIRRDVLQPILDEIAKAGADGKNPLLSRMGALGTVADKIWTWAKAADDRMLQAYQMEDEIFRMATYMRRRSLGDSVEVAAKNAREQFLDYDIRAPWVNAARNTVLPFISYSYRAIPKIAENISNRPWKLAKYFALAYAANALAYMWDDGDDGEDRERASLRDEEQGYTWLGIPRMMRMPYRDADGMPVFLDVRRWIPAGDVFDTNQGQSAVPVPAPLQLGGPLMLAFEFALNKQAFTGNEITNDLTDTPGDKVGKVSDWLWKSWMPSAAWVPNSWYWEKIENALKGAEDYTGRKYSLPEASLSSIGIKLKPQNVDDGLGWKYRAMQDVERALRTEGRRLSNRRERGLISESEFNKSMAELSEKFTNLQAKADELGKRAKPKGQTDRSSEPQP